MASPTSLPSQSVNQDQQNISIVATVIAFTVFLYFLKQFIDSLQKYENCRARNDWQSAVENEQRELAAKNYVAKVKTIAEMAKTDWYSEIKLPGAVSATGVKYGMFSFIRHNRFTVDIDSEIASIRNANSRQAMETATNALIRKGSLWSKNQSHNHSYANFFLLRTRKDDVVIYKKIVGDAYGYTFAPDYPITLYRRDTRPVHQIFAEGFEPKQNSRNLPVTQKSNYANPVSLDYGVSFSKKIPPAHYGNTGYFKVSLPAHHRLLLVDIVKSPRNKYQLTAYHHNLQEVNSIDPIPKQYIESHVRTTLYGDVVTKNHNYNPNYKVTSLPPRGCL